MLGILKDRVSDLFVTRTLRLGKNASVKVTNANGSESTISLTELASLDGLTASVAELNILDGVTATAAEINMACDNSANCEVVAATNVITATESGKTFFLNHATEFVSTLPAPAIGLRYKFIVTGAPSGASYTVVTTSGANLIYGSAEVNGASVPAVAEDTVTFTDGAAAIGDWIEVISDGTNWYVSGLGVAATAIAFTAT